jgi:hypothetical protein
MLTHKRQRSVDLVVPQRESGVSYMAKKSKGKKGKKGKK